MEIKVSFSIWKIQLLSLAYGWSMSERTCNDGGSGQNQVEHSVNGLVRRAALHGEYS